MKKTSVYLTEGEASQLARVARVEGTSQADVIRKAIRAYLPKGAGDRDFVSARVADGPGGSIAEVPEEDLLTGFGEE